MSSATNPNAKKNWIGTRRGKTKSKKAWLAKPRRVRSTIGSRIPNVIPNMLKTKLSYGDVWEFNSGAGATYARNLFCINSIYDSDKIGVGGQPTGHDELATLYTKYQVYAVKIRYHVINQIAYPMLVNADVGDADHVWPASGTDVQQYCLEMPNTQSLELLPYTYGDHCSGWLKRFIRIKDIFRGQSVKGTDFSALCGADPAKLAYSNIAVADASGARVNIQATVIVKITYYVKFFGKKINVED